MKILKTSIWAASAALALSCTAHAAGTSAVDRKYLMQNAQGSVYDAATAEVAVQKGGTTAVVNYGLMLMRDHNRLNMMMLQLANRRNIALPVILLRSDETKLRALMSKGGTAFDRAYLREAVRINAEDVKDGQKELSVTRDPEIRAVVGDFVNTEKKHLRDARFLLARSMKM